MEEQVRLWLVVLASGFSLIVSFASFLYVVFRDRKKEVHDAMETRLQPIETRFGRFADRYDEQGRDVAGLKAAQERLSQEITSHVSENNFRFQSHSDRMQGFEHKIEKLSEQIHDDIQELAAAIREAMSQNAATLKAVLDRIPATKEEPTRPRR